MATVMGLNITRKRIGGSIIVVVRYARCMANGKSRMDGTGEGSRSDVFGASNPEFLIVPISHVSHLYPTMM